MNRSATLKALLLEAGGLLLFWGCDALGYDRYAPMAALAFVLSDTARRRWQTLGFPYVWRVFTGLALGLAALDIAARGQAWASFESIGANVLIAGVFAVSAFGKTPLVQAVAEQRYGKSFPENRHDLKAFFRAYTGVWAAYFAARAFTWLWLIRHLPLDRAHALQGMIGPISLFAMIAVSFQGQMLFRGLSRLGAFRM